MNEDRESSANVPKEHQKIYRRWDVTRLPKQRRDLAAMVRRVIQEVLKRVLERTLRAAPDTSCLQLLVGQAVDEVLLIRRRATI